MGLHVTVKCHTLYILNANSIISIRYIIVFLNIGMSFFVDVVNRLDSSIGRVMKALADKNILDNTIVVFISDNGAQTQGLFRNYGSNWPLRGVSFCQRTLRNSKTKKLMISAQVHFVRRGRKNCRCDL